MTKLEISLAMREKLDFPKARSSAAPLVDCGDTGFVATVKQFPERTIEFDLEISRVLPNG